MWVYKFGTTYENNFIPVLISGKSCNIHPKVQIMNGLYSMWQPKNEEKPNMYLFIVPFSKCYFSQRRLNLKIVLLLLLAKKHEKYLHQIILSAEQPFATLFHSLFSKGVRIKVLLELFIEFSFQVYYFSQRRLNLMIVLS